MIVPGKLSNIGEILLKIIILSVSGKNFVFWFYLHKYVVLGMVLLELVFVEYMFFVVDIDMGYKTILGTGYLESSLGMGCRNFLEGETSLGVTELGG